MKLLLFALLVGLLHCVAAQRTSIGIWGWPVTDRAWAGSAIAYLQATSNAKSSLSGTVTFTESSNGVSGI